MVSIIDSDDDSIDYYKEKRFTPFDHQPMIKSKMQEQLFCMTIRWVMITAKYAHAPEEMDKIRRQTEAVFSDMLVQKGLNRVCIDFIEGLHVCWKFLCV